MDTKIVKRAIINSVATAAYVTLVGLFMSNANVIFGRQDKWLTPVAVLMLLVLSAGVTATLVFGQPAMWYVDGKKKQALQLLGYTLACFAVLTLAVFLSLAALNR